MQTSAHSSPQQYDSSRSHMDLTRTPETAEKEASTFRINHTGVSWSRMLVEPFHVEKTLSVLKRWQNSIQDYALNVNVSETVKISRRCIGRPATCIDQKNERQKNDRAIELLALQTLYQTIHIVGSPHTAGQRIENTLWRRSVRSDNNIRRQTDADISRQFQQILHSMPSTSNMMQYNKCRVRLWWFQKKNRINKTEPNDNNFDTTTEYNIHSCLLEIYKLRRNGE